jgi:RimJ/RimL family protein N-acetyltransferase
MGLIEPVTLEGDWVILEPLDMAHADGLADAVRDGDLWKLWFTTIPKPEDIPMEIERRLGLRTAGSMLPFAVRRKDTQALCGMTTYMNVDATHRRLEIGSTWYAKSAQHTGINTEAKLLLLTHAFETLRCIAVEFRTHWMNHASRNAIARLGAKQDGVLRNHMRMPDGSYRDTVVFSIIESEWPTVKRHLRFKLDR